ncbi:MAG: peptidyl-prolyl cis-trans isomerase [Spirochaetaceae bacterium]|nr:peptidyl-prolyl cis-trans isomerase [Spirochaetaceae bacterium]
MKKTIFTFLACSVLFVSAVFAQNDLQVVAEVNYTTKYPITLGTLKLYVKNMENQAGRNLTVEERRQVLDSVIDRKLLFQTAEKQGVKISDSQVNEYFSAMISNIVGQQITEKQFEAKLKESGMSTSLDNFMKENVGMGVAQYKDFIREELTIQSFVMSLHSDEIQNVKVTKEEVVQRYDINKQSLVRPDMVTAFIVAVEKKGKTSSEKAKIDSLRARLASNPRATEQIEKEAKQDDSGFVAVKAYFYKNEQVALSLGITMAQLLEIFNMPVNTVTEVKEMNNNFQFFVVLAKDSMKFLTLDDKLDPSQNITIREYIENEIKAAKQQQAYQNASNVELSNVKTDKTYKISKSDAELKKLLAW